MKHCPAPVPLLLAAALLTAPAFAQSPTGPSPAPAPSLGQGNGPVLAGSYQVRGIGANGQTAYAGKVQVSPTGQTYRVEWSLSGGKEVYVGTGIRVNDTFSVIYVAPNAPNKPGLVQYSLQKDGSLTGYYTSLGAQTISAEAWIPEKL